MIELPEILDYPIIAIGDVHGQLDWLDQLVERLRSLTEWPGARLVFLGDLVDRGPEVRGVVSRVLELIAEKPGSTCVMGNHDLALVKAAGLDGEPSESWVRRYADHYDHDATFQSYLKHETPDFPLQDWRNALRCLRDAIPMDHQHFLSRLPWAATASCHLFLHNGLSRELDCPATVQLVCLQKKLWDRAVVSPRFASVTDRLFDPEYPVWLGADKRLSSDPMPFPGKIQVIWHIRVDVPEANAVRIRIDTSGGVRQPLTACLLRGPTSEPEFIFSSG